MKVHFTRKSRKKLERTRITIIKKRKREMKKAKLFLIKWSREVLPNTCVACGEFNKYCLDRHHITGKQTVALCASCHRIFDKSGGIKELRERRKIYYKYNLKIKRKLL